MLEFLLAVGEVLAVGDSEVEVRIIGLVDDVRRRGGADGQNHGAALGAVRPLRFSHRFSSFRPPLLDLGFLRRRNRER